MRPLPRLAQRSAALIALVALAGCAVPPFKPGTPQPAQTVPPVVQPGPGAVPEVPAPPPDSTGVTEPPVEIVPPPAPPPRERPKAPPAQLGAASKSLVSQAQAQRKRGDLPGASVSLERALRIEPNNPLLWIEMGRLRMDQRNFAQAESMGRKAISMAPGDARTQSSAWLLIADSLKARGKNIQAQEAVEKSRQLATL
jgi:Tfp pilus assembly protein PilF